MRLVIETQDYENYGAHEGFDGTYYWKAKGGETYVIELGNEFNVFGADAEIDALVKKADEIFDIVRNDDYFQSNIISTEVLGTNERTYREERDDEFDAEWGVRDVRYWPQVLDLDTGVKTLKFRGVDGKIYYRTWAYENGEIKYSCEFEEESA